VSDFCRQILPANAAMGRSARELGPISWERFLL